MALLKVNNMKKSFGELKVLKGIDFELNKGEILAIIGSSGSGKTTLLRCINFLERADEGQIYIDDKMLFDAKNGELSDAELRNKRLNFGLVFQSFNLFPQYNVIQNVTLSPLLIQKEQCKNQRRQAAKQLIKNFFKAGSIGTFKESMSGIRLDNKNAVKEIEERAVLLLERVGLADKIKGYPCELSGGQCQRVAIARALALSPKILCFDEPTSALDPELTGEVLKVIKGLKSKDNTMIIVTHEMEFARNIADKVIFMADGVIEEMGTPSELFDNPKSAKTSAFLLKGAED